MNTDTIVGYRLTVEAVGHSQSDAAAHALRLIGCMIEDRHFKGHSCGSETGNACGKWEATYANSQPATQQTNPVKSGEI